MVGGETLLITLITGILCNRKKKTISKYVSHNQGIISRIYHTILYSPEDALIELNKYIDILIVFFLLIFTNIRKLIKCSTKST